MVNIIMKILVVVATLIVGAGSVMIFKMKNDNVIEEVCEKIIESETGLDVDLSPQDSDNKTPAGNDKPAGGATEEKKIQ